VCPSPFSVALTESQDWIIYKETRFILADAPEAVKFKSIMLDLLGFWSGLWTALIHGRKWKCKRTYADERKGA
jgi:hypothetical protein